MRNQRRWRIGMTALVALASFTVAPSHPILASSEAKSAPAPVQVSIDNFSFGMTTLTISAGTTVTWVNKDDVPHTVVSSDKPRLFASPPLDTDEKFSYTFAKPGTYAYFCSIHPKMTAKVVVN